MMVELVVTLEGGMYRVVVVVVVTVVVVVVVSVVELVTPVVW